MALRFTVLASGSGGNASFIHTDGFGLLLDVGLGPRQLATRLQHIGATWRQVDAVLLTHTHSDHWNDRTLAYLRRQQILLYCHAGHHEALLTYGQEFAELRAAGLVRGYEAEHDLELAAGLHCRPIPVRHDGGATFGFRLEKQFGLFGNATALAYAADLGSWTPELAHEMANVELLALEFNHDLAMEYASGRSAQLIQRVLGDAGHLSNAQAMALVQAVLQNSTPGRLQHLVQLHLSRECNHPLLAQEAARCALADHSGITVHTASQDVPGQTLCIPNGRRPGNNGRKASARSRQLAEHPWLPGFEP